MWLAVVLFLGFYFDLLIFLIREFEGIRCDVRSASLLREYESWNVNFSFGGNNMLGWGFRRSGVAQQVEYSARDKGLRMSAVYRELELVSRV